MIRTVHYGPHDIEPWFQSMGYIDLESKSLKSYRCKEPRPIWQSLVNTPNLSKDTELELYLCPHCLLYTSNSKDIPDHIPNCRFKSGPPGGIIYDGPDFIIRRLDTDSTAENLSTKMYMQCVALFGRMFLDSKSICFALDGFWLYTAHDKRTGLLAGFFSREKQSWHNYNLACIVVFPPFQGMGLGQLLIGLSYYLTRREHTTGSPEQPLSEFGRKSYLSYWKKEVSNLLQRIKRKTDYKTLGDIALELGMEVADVVTALEALNIMTTCKDGSVQIDLTHFELNKIPLESNKKGFDEKYAVDTNL